MKLVLAIGMALLAGCGSDDSCRCRGVVGARAVDLLCGATECVEGTGYRCLAGNQLVLDELACGTAALPDLASASRRDLGADCESKSCAELGAACGTVVDNCGGRRECGTCGAGQSCTAQHTCIETCSDGVKSGDETDVDCGGARCGKCALEKACVADGDCAAGTSCDARVCRQGSYAKLQPLPTQRHLAAVTTSADGKIYVLGGIGSAGGSELNKVEVYTPASNSWTALTGMGTARAAFGASFGNDGKIYVAAGRRGASVPGSSVTGEVYDPVAKTWTALPTLEKSRTGGQMMRDGDGKLYMLGGWEVVSQSCGTGCTSNVDTSLDTVESFTPGGGAWASTSIVLLNARHQFAAVPLADGGWLVAGGARYMLNPAYDRMCTGYCAPKELSVGATTVERCDTTGCSSVSTMPKVGTSVDGFWVSGAQLGDAVYFFGAEERFSSTGVAWKYAGGTWTRLSSGQTGTINGAAAIDGKIYVVGIRELYLFTP